jgi:hypothetical protein
MSQQLEKKEFYLELEDGEREHLRPSLSIGEAVVISRRKLMELLLTMADYPNSVDPEVVRSIVQKANAQTVLEVGKPRDWKWLEINVKEIPTELDSSTGHPWATLTLRGKGLE